jgi:hypothetical protein
MLRPLCLKSLAALTLLLAAGTAPAQVVPFAVVGAGAGPDGLPLPGQPAGSHWAVGAATGLGVYFGEGSVQTDSAMPDPTNPAQIVGQFGSGSPFVFAGLTGDKLVCWYGRTDHGAKAPGTFTLTILGATAEGAPIVEALWVAEFVVQPKESTGRFAGATGSWVMYARSAPFVLGSDDPVYYAWEGTGSLTLKKKKK